MAICPICNNMIEDKELICKECGYDESLDYEKYPTLQVLSGNEKTNTELKEYYEKVLDEKKEAEKSNIIESDIYKELEKKYEKLKLEYVKIKKENIEFRNAMVQNIKASHREYMSHIIDDSLEIQVDEIKELVRQIEWRQELASRQADRMLWIALKPEIFEKKNIIIISNLNRYLQEIDDFYKKIRGDILVSQVKEFEDIIVKKIKEYKDIDERLIRRIANISDTDIPPSKLNALNMNDYSNEQKVMLNFNILDKNAYKRDLERAFNAQTVEQFIAYKEEIIEVAQQRTDQIVTEFINSINTSLMKKTIRQKQ